MDSGNSGSIPSSSGGDEEFDSRAESISAFLNTSGHFSQNPLIPPSFHNPSSSLFNPISSYLNTFSQSPQPPNTNSLLNLQVFSPADLRSEPNSSITRPPMASSSLQGSSSRPSSIQSSQTHIPLQKNSKKRSRASRRAPTTVLTTDTSNFRAMVQEFTGIPAPPFSADSQFPRRRLNPAPTPAPPYLLRPFALKVQLPFSSTNIMQDPPFTFQSLLQSQHPNYFGAESQGMLEEFSINHGHINPNLVSSEGLSLRSENYPAKMNYLAAASSDFYAEKGSENVPLRSEGMVDSWICSSDKDFVMLEDRE